MKRVLAILLAALAAAPAATAQAAGGPVGAVQGGAGVGVPGRPDRYVAVQLHSGTLVERLRHGSVFNTTQLPGSLGVPAADYNGSTTGLSADGRTLVLTPVTTSALQHTSFLVLDAHRLKVRREIDLDGWFTLDAVSPDGGRLYLIHYRNGNVLRYEVRAYDLASRRLLPDPIVDPREPDEKMVGMPMARTMSADGRWAYTLYARPEDAPFIHALDTQRGTAACIDLDNLAGADVSAYRLVAPKDGGPLRVVSAAGTQALVDRRTFKVASPVAPQAPAKPAPRADTGGGAGVWIAALGALAAVAALAGIAAARRRRYDRSASLRNAS